MNTRRGFLGTLLGAAMGVLAKPLLASVPIPWSNRGEPVQQRDIDPMLYRLYPHSKPIDGRLERLQAKSFDEAAYLSYLQDPAIREWIRNG